VAVLVTDCVVVAGGPALPRRRPTITAAVRLGGIIVSAWGPQGSAIFALLDALAGLGPRSGV
jgi:hypothetical protein